MTGKHCLRCSPLKGVPMLADGNVPQRVMLTLVKDAALTSCEGCASVGHQLSINQPATEVFVTSCRDRVAADPTPDQQCLAAQKPGNQLGSSAAEVRAHDGPHCSILHEHITSCWHWQCWSRQSQSRFSRMCCRQQYDLQWPAGLFAGGTC